MEELEPWEALDLDDSDLPFLLRRCKRPRSTTPPAAAQTSLSQLQNHPEQLQNPPSTSSSRRLAIPGPAGAVHAAMLRKDLDRENRNFSNHQTGYDGVISTQDYIRKAMDDDSTEFDDDFSRHPWLSALKFLGSEDGLIPTKPISSIKKCVNGDKVVQVVAVVKSSTPNGLGGLLMSLKDPTGTIGASIHHKVLSQSEFGKELTVGAVLILQEVAIFTPVKSAHYLNVTLRNLVKDNSKQQWKTDYILRKLQIFDIFLLAYDLNSFLVVFCQSKASTSELFKSAYPVQYADPDSCRKARAVEKMSTVMSQYTGTKSTRNDNAIQRQILFKGSTQSNNRDSTNITAAKRGSTTLSQHAGNEGPEDMIGTRITGGNVQELENGTIRGVKGSNFEDSLIKDTDNVSPLAETTTGEAQGTQPLMSKATLPQWTDEQLDELFGDEDDGCLF